jgi:hypothetical protein
LTAFGGRPASTIDTAARWSIVDARRMGDDEMTVYKPPG